MTIQSGWTGCCAAEFFHKEPLTGNMSDGRDNLS